MITSQEEGAELQKVSVFNSALRCLVEKILVTNICIGKYAYNSV